jgi:hypothetical protein
VAVRDILRRSRLSQALLISSRSGEFSAARGVLIKEGGPWDTQSGQESARLARVVFDSKIYIFWGDLIMKSRETVLVRGPEAL